MKKCEVHIGIIGAGPVGLHMSCKFQTAGIKCTLLEKGQIGQSIMNWPPGIRFHSSPYGIGIGGIPLPMTSLERLTREEYLAYLRQVVNFFELDVRTFEGVYEVKYHLDTHFTVLTETLFGEKKAYKFSHLILATGTQGTPIVPKIPGIETANLLFPNCEPHIVFNKSLLIIGGRHSALEFAIRSVYVGASRIVICARGKDFDREGLKTGVIEDIEKFQKNGIVELFHNTEIAEINKSSIAVRNRGQKNRIEISGIDFVVAACGFSGSFNLYNQIGIKLTNKMPHLNVETRETNIPQCYIIGTASAGEQISGYDWFIDNTLKHVDILWNSLKM